MIIEFINDIEEKIESPERLSELKTMYKDFAEKVEYDFDENINQNQENYNLPF